MHFQVEPFIDEECARDAFVERSIAQKTVEALAEATFSEDLSAEARQAIASCVDGPAVYEATAAHVPQGALNRDRVIDKVEADLAIGVIEAPVAMPNSYRTVALAGLVDCTDMGTMLAHVLVQADVPALSEMTIACFTAEFEAADRLGIEASTEIARSSSSARCLKRWKRSTRSTARTTTSPKNDEPRCCVGSSFRPS